MPGPYTRRMIQNFRGLARALDYFKSSPDDFYVQPEVEKINKYGSGKDLFCMEQRTKQEQTWGLEKADRPRERKEGRYTTNYVSQLGLAAKKVTKGIITEHFNQCI